MSSPAGASGINARQGYARPFLHLELCAAQARRLPHRRTLTGTSRDTSRVYLLGASLYCRILFRAGFPLPGAALSPGLLPEGAGEGVGVSGHGPGQGAVAGSMPRSGARSSWSYPAPGSDRGRLDRVEDGGVALVDAAPHPLTRFPGRISVEHPGGGGLAGVAAEFGRPGTSGGGTSVRRRPACRISRPRLRSNGTVRYQNCPNACRHARIGRPGRVMRRIGQAASRSQVLRCRGCSGVEKAILATTTP
jgi:hypothetical protein